MVSQAHLFARTRKIRAPVAIKANEAVVKGQKITFQNDWFELG